MYFIYISICIHLYASSKGIACVYIILVHLQRGKYIYVYILGARSNLFSFTVFILCVCTGT